MLEKEGGRRRLASRPLPTARTTTFRAPLRASPFRSRFRPAAATRRCSERLRRSSPPRRKARRRLLAAPDQRRADRADACSHGHESERGLRSPAQCSNPLCTRRRGAPRGWLPGATSTHRCRRPTTVDPPRHVRSPTSEDRQALLSSRARGPRAAHTSRPARTTRIPRAPTPAHEQR